MFNSIINTRNGVGALSLFIDHRLSIIVFRGLVFLVLIAALPGCGEKSSTGALQPVGPEAEPVATEPLTPGPSPLSTGARGDETQSTAKPPAAAKNSAPPAGSRLPARPSSSKARGVRDLSFDDIKFDMEKGTPFLRSMFTPEIEALFGQKIRIRGWILPTDKQTLTSFVLVRDNMECCFGPGAALFDCIVVNMAPGKTAEFTTRPIAVEGTLAFREMLDPDGGHLAIYHLTADKAE